MATIAEAILSAAKKMRARPQQVRPTLDRCAIRMESGDRFARWVFVDGSSVRQDINGLAAE